MSLDIESLKEILNGFDPTGLLPEVGGIVDTVATVCRIAILIGPILMVAMGLGYLLFAPKEANYYFGYRTTFGMGSVSAWRHTQKVAGFLFLAAGAVLSFFMLMTSASFGSGDAMAMVWRAFRCLILQAVVLLIINLTVGSIAAMTFDYKGNKRRK